MKTQWSIREWWTNDWNNIGPYKSMEDAVDDAIRRFKGYTYGGSPIYLEILVDGKVIEKWTRDRFIGD